MENIPDYLKDDLTEADDSLTQLKEKVDFFMSLDEQIKAREKETKELKKKLNQLSQEEIPNLVLAKGLSRLKLATGETIDIKEGLNVKITNNEEFIKFLQGRQEDDIVKTMVSLDRMPSNMLTKLYNFLNSNDYPYKAETGVHPKTREKYFKELLGVELDEAKRAEYIKQGRCIDKDSLPNFVEVWLYHKTRVK